jgi:hypothetical protein
VGAVYNAIGCTARCGAVNHRQWLARAGGGLTEFKMVMQANVWRRLSIFWGASFCGIAGVTLIREYLHPGEAKGIPRMIVRLWCYQYWFLPRAYMLSVGIVCVTVGLMLAMMGVVAHDARRS